MVARIYRPARTAMQQGTAKDKWLLDFEPTQGREVEPLMGYTASADMTSQVRLTFDTREEAVAYATANGIPHRVEEPKETSPKTVIYSDNFKFDRIGQWTH